MKKTKIKGLPFITRIITIDGKKTHYLTRDGYLHKLEFTDKDEEVRDDQPETAVSRYVDEYIRK